MRAPVHDTIYSIFLHSSLDYLFGREAMKVQLDLKRHCIETEMKRRTNAAISSYFKAGSEKIDLEKEITLLQQALGAFDFLELRSRWPALSGGSGTRVSLALDATGQPNLRFESTCITPPANQKE
jgi:hypothetical protein